MIGLSLSTCIYQLVRGTVRFEEVDKIISGTRCESPIQWEKLFEIYGKSCWRGSATSCQMLTLMCLERNMIEQPRITRGLVPKISNAVWVNSEKKIEWMKVPD